MTIRVLNIPGLWNSGATHWQTNWERERGDTRRVLQDEWERPRREDWTRRIRDELRALPAPVVLAAHSLGCCTVAHLARDAAPDELAKVRGALLVAPSDVEAPAYPPGTEGFAPMPLLPLPFPAIVIGSSNDEYVTEDRARFFAQQWGARYVDAGPLGHLNSASNLGMWPLGQALLEELLHEQTFPGSRGVD
ncbi:MAG TPA: alpha/beta fold hydrolase [Myxococcales bacterium]